MNCLKSINVWLSFSLVIISISISILFRKSDGQLLNRRLDEKCQEKIWRFQCESSGWGFTLKLHKLPRNGQEKRAMCRMEIEFWKFPKQANAKCSAKRKKWKRGKRKRGKTTRHITRTTRHSFKAKNCWIINFEMIRFFCLSFCCFAPCSWWMSRCQCEWQTKRWKLLVNVEFHIPCATVSWFWQTTTRTVYTFFLLFFFFGFFLLIFSG